MFVESIEEVRLPKILEYRNFASTSDRICFPTLCCQILLKCSCTSESNCEVRRVEVKGGITVFRGTYTNLTTFILIAVSKLIVSNYTPYYSVPPNIYGLGHGAVSPI